MFLVWKSSCAAVLVAPAAGLVIGAVAERLAERLGARVLAADGTGNGDGPEQQLMRHLINAFAEYERMVIGARTKAALRVKKMRGERVGAIPIGFRLADDEGMLEEDPREQAAICLIHELREDGLSLRAIDKDVRPETAGADIVRKLGELGFPRRDREPAKAD